LLNNASLSRLKSSWVCILIGRSLAEERRATEEGTEGGKEEKEGEKEVNKEIKKKPASCMAAHVSEAESSPVYLVHIVFKDFKPCGLLGY
jgi:hypothetical protein